MRAQRGFAWGKLIAAIVVLGLIYAIFHVVTSYIRDVDAKGYQRGKKETEAAYAQRDNAALRAANAEIQRLQNEARATERKHAQALASLDRKRQQEADNARKQADADRAAVAAGTLWLRDPGAAAACAAASGPRAGAEAGAAAGQRDAGAGGKLSPAFAGFLLTLVNEADDIARQLGDAQALILDQVKTCNGP